MPELRLSERNLRERELMQFAIDLYERRSLPTDLEARDAAEIVALRRRVKRLLERSCNEGCEEGSRLHRSIERWTYRLEVLAGEYDLCVTYPGLWPMLQTREGFHFNCPC